MCCWRALQLSFTYTVIINSDYLTILTLFTLLTIEIPWHKQIISASFDLYIIGKEINFKIKNAIESLLEVI